MQQKNNRDNVDCALYGTKYCDILNNQSCDDCYVAKMDSDDQNKTMKDVELVSSMLPGGCLDELTNADTCQLCRERAEKPAYYAFIDYGNPEPRGKKSSAIGIKVKTSVGSIVPLQIPACAKCRKNHLIADFLPLCAMVLIVMLGIVIIALPPVAAALAGVNEILPLAVFVLLIPLGWVAGTAIGNVFIKKAVKETIFDTREIPYVKKLAERGWFPITSDGKNAQRLIFSKEKRKRGWFC